ncbi:hypothetical protein ACFQ0B_01060 [Nonomuraea thailandensis]
MLSLSVPQTVTPEYVRQSSVGSVLPTRYMRLTAARHFAFPVSE